MPCLIQIRAYGEPMQYQDNILAAPDEEGILEHPSATLFEIPDSVAHDLGTVLSEALEAVGVYETDGFNVEVDGDGFIVYSGEEPFLSVENAASIEDEDSDDENFLLLLDEGF